MPKSSLDQKTRVTLLTGFLGAGKTTTLKRLLGVLSAAEACGAIVNDLSGLEVDGELVRLGDRVSERDGNLASVCGGSISSERREEFVAALRAMRERGLSHILVEASGASTPGPILEVIQNEDGFSLATVIALVDARALVQDFGGGPDLVRHLAAGESSGIEWLLGAQLHAASVIALSKVDLVAEEDLELLLRSLRVINPSAGLTVCTFGGLDPSWALEAGPYLQRAADWLGDVASDPADFDIGNTVVRDARPFHPARLFAHYQTRLGLGIFRSKGFIWMASRPDDVLLWNQAGGTMGLELLGTWRAAAVEDERLLDEEREALQAALDQAHPVFGDRGNEITIIGTRRDREIFCRELADCFCTSEEVEAWQDGAVFDDPWPKSVRAVQG